MMIGTGGVANATVVNAAIRPRSNASNQVRITICNPVWEVNEQREVLLPQEQIAGIQRYLSLNVTDLSKALRVGRPTIYAWIRGAQLHDAHILRLQQLYRIARSWRAISSSPIGTYLNVQLPSGNSLIEQLADETLDESVINRSFIQIKAAVDGKPRRESISEVTKRRGLRSTTKTELKKWSGDDEFNL